MQLNHRQKAPGDWQAPLPCGKAYPEGYLVAKTGAPHAWIACILERSPYRPDRLFDDHDRDRTDAVFAWCELEPPIEEETDDVFTVGDVVDGYRVLSVVGASNDGTNGEHNPPDYGVGG